MKAFSLLLASLLLMALPVFSQEDTITPTLNKLEGIEKAKYLNILANQYLHISLPKALEYAKEAKKIAEEEGDIEILITSSNQIASVSFQRGEYDKALELYLEILEISLKNKKEKMSSNLYNNIGNVFYVQGKADMAIQYYQKSLEIEEKLVDSLGIGDSYLNLANVLIEKKEFEQALDYINRALPYYEGLKDSSSIAVAYNNMGTIYEDKKEYQKALDIYQKALDINRRINVTENIAYNLQNIGEIYLFLEQPDNAIKSYLESNRFGIEFKNLVKDNYELLSIAYEKKGNVQKALEYYKKFAQLKDTLFSEESEKRISELNAKFETAQKEQQIQLLTQSNEIQELEIGQKNIFLYTTLLVSLLILGLALLYYNRYRLKNKANFLLAAANNEIRQSATEKEILLQEIHHRVKNNLQLISSILSWQGESIQDPSMLRMIEESKSRIKSMALIHETLYRSQNLAQVKVDEYFSDLIRYVQESFHLKKRITMDAQVEALALTAEIVIPLGLIVNELITNSYKYAFEEMEEGKILLVFKKREEGFYLKVEDNGRGLPENYQEKMKHSLGLQLVQTLCRQLKGKLEINLKDPTRFELRF